MTKRPLPIVAVRLDRIVGGGQTIGTLDDGRKLFAWGGLPGELVNVQITRKKSHFAEGYVVEVLESSDERIEPRDPASYLSTSPWQIMTFAAETRYKAKLIEEAFQLHDVVLLQPTDVYSDEIEYGYRNKIEFSFWADAETGYLDLAFFRRGSKGKVVITDTALASDEITHTSQQILEVLRAHKVSGRDLKTLLIRSNQTGDVAWQLYVKEADFPADDLVKDLKGIGMYGEIIYSHPKSPASVITKRLAATSDEPRALRDTIRGIPFSYATEGFFQINLPVYEKALDDMQKFVMPGKKTVDLYSGVGTIGLTIGGNGATLVEINEHAVREMRANIKELGLDATPVLAASETALDYIQSDALVIVDPPRAGLHENVVNRLLEVLPERIIYLSCNPVTQARDVMRLSGAYKIAAQQGYNFFPRTPHIEHLVVLDSIVSTAGGMLPNSHEL